MTGAMVISNWPGRVQCTIGQGYNSCKSRTNANRVATVQSRDFAIAYPQAHLLIHRFEDAIYALAIVNTLWYLIDML